MEFEFCRSDPRLFSPLPLVEYFDRSLRVIRQMAGEPIDLWHGDHFGGGQ